MFLGVTSNTRLNTLISRFLIRRKTQIKSTDNLIPFAQEKYPQKKEKGGKGKKST